MHSLAKKKKMFQLFFFNVDVDRDRSSLYTIKYTWKYTLNEHAVSAYGAVIFLSYTAAAAGAAVIAAAHTGGRVRCLAGAGNNRLEMTCSYRMPTNVDELLMMMACMCAVLAEGGALFLFLTHPIYYLRAFSLLLPPLDVSHTYLRPLSGLFFPLPTT